MPETCCYPGGCTDDAEPGCDGRCYKHALWVEDDLKQARERSWQAKRRQEIEEEWG